MTDLEGQATDAAFLRRILLGLVAAASLSGAMTVALWVLASLTFNFRPAPAF